MTPLEAAWSAGIFEGEGCIGHYAPAASRGHPRRYARLIVQMTDRDIIQRLHTVTGAGHVTTPSPRPGNKPLWRWLVSTRTEIEALYEAWEPWLGERRKAKFIESLTVSQ